MTTTNAKITYTKLRSGDWGVRGPAAHVLRGMSVTVTKRSGETKCEVVGRIIWTGQDKRTKTNVSIAEVVKQARARSPRGSRSSCRRCGCADPTCGGSGGGICRGPAFNPCHDCE